VCLFASVRLPVRVFVRLRLPGYPSRPSRPHTLLQTAAAPAGRRAAGPGGRLHQTWIRPFTVVGVIGFDGTIDLRRHLVNHTIFNTAIDG